jgi:hypothetical protein
MVPWLTTEDILDKQERYAPKRFLNEVIALPYESMGAPVTEKHIRKCCDDKFQMLKGGVIPQGVQAPIYAGIDWGTGLKSYTVLTFVAHIGGKWTMLRSKRFSGVEADANRQMELILEELHRFRPKAVSCDWGFGHLQNAQIKLKYTHGEVRTVFSSVGAAPIILDATGRYVINRSNMMSRVFNMILEERIRFPRFEDFGTFAKDILSIKAEDPDEAGVQKNTVKVCPCSSRRFFPFINVWLDRGGDCYRELNYRCYLGFLAGLLTNNVVILSGFFFTRLFFLAFLQGVFSTSSSILASKVTPLLRQTRHINTPLKCPSVFV